MKKHSPKRWNTGGIFLLVLCAIGILYFSLDIFDLPSKAGICVSRINNDMLGIFSGVFTALFIFFLTYCFVEQRNIKKQRNQEQVAKLFLTNAYDSCIFFLNGLDVVLQKLVERTDFSAYYSHNSPAAKYADIPFENEQKILQFAGEGMLSSDELEQYQSIKNEFQKHINLSVIFFDHPGQVQPPREDLLKSIEKAKAALLWGCKTK